MVRVPVRVNPVFASRLNRRLKPLLFVGLACSHGALLVALAPMLTDRLTLAVPAAGPNRKFVPPNEIGGGLAGGPEFAQVAPPLRVPSLPLPEASKALVPLPSSRG